MAPVAAILCGKHRQLSEYMIKNLPPKIEVVHVVNSTDTAVSEIPALLRGENVTPSSGLGSNAEGSARTDISLLIIGGGFPKDVIDTIKSAADSAKPIAIFCPDTSKTPPVGGPPPPEMIKKRMMAGIEREEKAVGEWAPGLYVY